MAVSFSIGDSHLHSTSTNFTASTSPFSISCWINAVWNNNAVMSMVGIYNGTTTAGVTTGCQIGTRTGTGDLVCWTYGGTILVAAPANTMTVYNNTWVNITYTYNGTTHVLYVNGVQLNTGTTPQIAGTFTQVWINGYPPSGTTNETSAFAVDTYTYYGRTLTSSEVSTIYYAAGARHGIFNGQLARYEFDELGQSASASAIIDLSGNGNTLSYVGASAAPTYSYATSYADSNNRAPL